MGVPPLCVMLAVVVNLIKIFSCFNFMRVLSWMGAVCDPVPLFLIGISRS